MKSVFNSTIAIILLLLIVFSCGKKSQQLSSQPKNLPSSTNSPNLNTGTESNYKGFPAFPNDDIKPRYVQVADDLVKGIHFETSKGTLNHIDFDNPDAYSIISDDTNPIAYAAYVSEGYVNRPISLSVVAKATKKDKLDPKELDFEYYVAVANFTKRSWDWFGPYSENKTIELNSTTKRDRYLSPTNKLHYVVLVAQNTKGQTIGASIVSTKSESSPTAKPTLPLYSSIALIHIGQNIVDPSVKRLSVIGPDQELTLVWKHKTVTPAEDNITEYEVYANEEGKSAPFLIAKKPAPTKDDLVTLKVISELDAAVQSKFEPSKTYTFYLRSVNNQGAALRSWGETATIPSVLPPTNLKASTNLAEGIQLTWTKSAGATGYKIYRDNQSKSIITLNDGNLENYIDTTVTDSKDHTYWLVALNGKEESGFSVGSTGKVPIDEPLATPTNVKASTDLVGRILITWDEVPGADYYLVKIDEVPNYFGSLTNKYLDLSQTDLYEHSYEICAYSKFRPASPYSAPVKGKMKSIGGTLPSSKFYHITRDRTDGVQVSWNPVPGATSYLLYKKYSDMLTIFLDQIDLTSTSYLDTKIPVGKSVTYYLAALSDTEKSIIIGSTLGERRVPEDSLEADEYMANAIPLAITDNQSTLKRTINQITDCDWFKFDAEKDKTYNFYTISTYGTDLFIYDKNGLMIDVDYFSNAQADNKYISFKPLKSDTYYVLVKSYSNLALEYYLVYNRGELPLIPPDVTASTNRSDGILIEYSLVSGAEEYHIYRDTLDTPIQKISAIDPPLYLDPIADYEFHNYWVVSVKGKKTSSASPYQRGKKYPKDIYEPDNTTANALLITPTSEIKTQARNISEAGDYDWVKFTGIKDVTYQFWSTGGLDTYISLYDSTITEIISDDDNGPGLNFYLTFTPTVSNVYYLQIRAYNNNAAGNYNFNYTNGFGYVKEESTYASANLDAGIKITWNTTINAEGYRIYRDSFDNKITEVGKIDNYTDIDIFDGEPHRYWVQPFNKSYNYAYYSPAWGQKVTNDSYEPNNKKSESKLLAFSDSLKKQKHGINLKKDEDWFKFDAIKDNEYHILTTSLSNYSMTITLYDQDGSTELKSVTSGATAYLDWVAPADGTYYAKVHCTDTNAIFMYHFYYYCSTDTLPMPPPQNVKATTDKTDGLYLWWDPVPNANLYRILIISPFVQKIDTYNNCFFTDAVVDTDLTFTVKAIVAYKNEYNQTIWQESKASAPVIGRMKRSLPPLWTSHNTKLSGVCAAILQPNNKPALILMSTTGQLQYIAANTEEPSKDTDWTSHTIDAIPFTPLSANFIGGKPVVVYQSGGKLIYNYSTKELPTAHGDWVKIVTGFDSTGNNLSLAEINKKPAILYVNNTNQLNYITCKTTIPVDGDPKNWEANVKLGKIHINEPFKLMADGTTGFPTFVGINIDNYVIYGLATKVLPTASDFIYNNFGKGNSCSLAMSKDGYPTVTYIPYNTTQLTFAYNTNPQLDVNKWQSHVIDRVAFTNGSSQLITGINTIPYVIYLDINFNPRIAHGNISNPTSSSDWHIFQIDNQTCNDRPVILDAKHITGIYQTDWDNYIFYTDLRD